MVSDSGIAPTPGADLLPHPTVAAPKCVDCQHHQQGPAGHNSRAHLCGHPVVPRSLVTGTPAQLCCDMRNDGSAGYVPAPGAVLQRCGAEGRLFEGQPGTGFVATSGEANPLQCGPGDRRYMVEPDPAKVEVAMVRRSVEAAESQLAQARLQKLITPPPVRRMVRDANGKQRWVYPPAEEAERVVLRARAYLAEALVAARRAGAPCALPAEQERAAMPDPALASGMPTDFVMLRVYDETAEGGSVEHTFELVDALQPHIAAMLADGGAFQLTFWGQGGRPKAVPQAGAPLQPLGTSADACATGPEPYSRTTSTDSCTDRPATAQA